MSAPTPADRGSLKELTIRGIVIGGIITIIFTAANVYLGLKAGLTFATSIPAAVISMAVLRYFKDHTIQENNIVQTIASAAGTLSAIIFVLPGLVMVGWWQGFPYWQSVFVIALGGILGVMYSIPLRRALVTNSDLPYPEGVAAAEVLKVGDTHEGAEESHKGLMAIVWGGLSSAAFVVLGSLKAVATEVSGVFRIGAGGTMAAGSLSLALIGVGHLVGLGVGIAMVVGLLISYGVLLPMQTWGHVEGVESLADTVGTVFKSEVRLMGAGTIAVAAVWTLLKLLGPIIGGIRDSLVSSSRRQAGQTVELTEQDLSAKFVIGTTIASMLPIGVLLWLFVRGTAIEHSVLGLIIVSILFILLTGLAVASVCGYMAGLIGASNSPISGVGIIVAIAAALVVKAVHGTVTGDQVSALVAYTLFTAAVVFGIATISNDNLQDLKTGQLVAATPWKQQVALVIGVVFGSIVIPPVLNLMQTAFGFQGAPGAGEKALAAPQASLISDLIKGVFGGDLNWNLIGVGAAIGVVVIIINEILTRTTKKLSLPGLAVGMGMYLPMAITIMIPIGALIGVLHDKWAQRQSDPERARRMGTLMATGLIVGESLWGVVYAGIVGFSGKDDPLALVPEGFEGLTQVIGVILFAGIVTLLYSRARTVGADK
ncbi:oligopeptide transporter, OPT family [Schaalia sp. 19OD2882]|uniref:OPT family oligopeptide transporter n=1 Tax=Schaalia sp. 19OD2882 TaxID=2794089 RepID=UPI001C1F1162|nr:oligopeptide transporter, OPT family [Schaalia sp. 19OD2882]QWW19040.1 oligopeptide transporter, OPT family [Schaalia sp. 19OD2882]